MGALDRYGDRTEDEKGVSSADTPDAVGAADPIHDPQCRRGWLPDDNEGRAVPCLACRPHLIGHRERLDRQLGARGPA